MRFKQAWQKRKCKTDFRLGEINTCLKSQITKPSSEQQNNMINELIMKKKNMAWSYSTSLTKDPNLPEAKGFTKYTNKPTNIAKTQSVFRLSEINTCLKFQIRYPSSEQQNYMLQDLNMAK